MGAIVAGVVTLLAAPCTASATTYWHYVATSTSCCAPAPGRCAVSGITDYGAAIAIIDAEVTALFANSTYVSNGWTCTSRIIDRRVVGPAPYYYPGMQSGCTLGEFYEFQIKAQSECRAGAQVAISTGGWDVRGYTYSMHFPEAGRNLRVVISPEDGEAESASIVTSVEPDMTSETLIARVYDADTGETVADADVKLELVVAEYSGGHIHADNDERQTRYAGTLSTDAVAGQRSITGTTGPDGLRFRFTAPAIAGDHMIVAHCVGQSCRQDGPDTVWVGIKGLIPLADSSVYTLIGWSDSHPDNHYMTYEALLKVTALAALYHARHQKDPVLHLNDASLERGGLFDHKATWTAPHETHRHGDIIDIRANPAVNPDSAIPETRFAKFITLSARVGGTAELHSPGTNNQHFHVRF